MLLPLFAYPSHGYVYIDFMPSFICLKSNFRTHGLELLCTGFWGKTCPAGQRFNLLDVCVPSDLNISTYRPNGQSTRLSRVLTDNSKVVNLSIIQIERSSLTFINAKYLNL